MIVEETIPSAAAAPAGPSAVDPSAVDPSASYGLLYAVFQQLRASSREGIAVAVTSANPGEGVTHSVNAIASVLGKDVRSRVLRIDARRLRAVTGPPVKMLDCCLRIDANVFEFVCEAAGFVPTPSTPDFRDGARQVHEARGEARAEGQSRTWGSDCDYRRDCMRELRLAFDYILIDCPALHSAADVFSLSPLVDGIVLVVEAGKTRRDQVLQAERSIGFARGKLIGQILNKRTFIVPHWLYKRL